MGVGAMPAASSVALASRSWSRLSPMRKATWCRPGRISLGAAPEQGMRRAAVIVGLISALLLAGCEARPAEEPKAGETQMVDKADLQVCLLTGTPMTLDDCAKAEATEQATRVGSAALKAPDVMRQ